jgi:F-type H+-transporting ATPase subunit gamma
MAQATTIKRRIGSVKNTRQITKAMELVAASKMRKTQDQAKRSRDYRVAAHSLLTGLSQITEVEKHPLFVKRPIKIRLYVVVTSNRGLAGAYNSNVLRLLSKRLLADRDSQIKSHVIAVGNKGAQFVKRLEGVSLLAAYPGFGDEPTANDIRPILNEITGLYRSEEVDDVEMIYTELKSNINQEVRQMNLLPARYFSEEPVKNHEFREVTFEPSIDEVLNKVVIRLLEVEIWQAMLESTASEHSMRMMAMKNATDNATDLIDDLTLAFNTARQSAITQELAEITGGAEAMSN